MYETSPYHELWNCCEYYLTLALSGVNTRSFDLIREKRQGQDLSDAYIFERLTRPALARNARGIKRFVQNHTERNKLGELEGTARSLAQSLKASLCQEVVQELDSILAQSFSQTLFREDAPETLLTLAALYHAHHRNRDITGAAIPKSFFRVFYPLLVKSRKGDMAKLADWHTALAERFSRLWEGPGTRTEKLTAFFEHKTTQTVVSYALAGILGFMREEKEKTVYLFEVSLKLPASEIQQFTRLIANGLNTLLGKEKRYRPEDQDPKAGRGRSIGVVPEDQIRAIVDEVVDLYFDQALDWCVQYQFSVAEERPKAKLSKQADKTFLEMNRHLWREVLLVADIRKREAFRTRHLLRLIIHYLFEARHLEREIWQKYIPSVDQIIDFAYENDREKLRKRTTLLGKQLSLYRDKGKYHDTDWEGFYRDDLSRDIALQVIREITDKAGSPVDGNLPAIWFANQVGDGLEDQRLYRFFKQSTLA